MNEGFGQQFIFKFIQPQLLALIALQIKCIYKL